MHYNTRKFTCQARFKQTNTLQLLEKSDFKRKNTDGLNVRPYRFTLQYYLSLQ